MHKSHAGFSAPTRAPCSPPGGARACPHSAPNETPTEPRDARMGLFVGMGGTKHCVFYDVLLFHELVVL